MRHAPRPGKPLLVLDLDYTLYDYKSTAETLEELQRPGMHSFLTRMYRCYDLCIWSQTTPEWLDTKLEQLGISTHSEYKLSFVLTAHCMIRIKRPCKDRHYVKPLQLIWNQFPTCYGPHNTIHVDDLSRNFALNPKNGLKIRPFKNALLTRAQDEELVHVGSYLLQLSLEQDFRLLNHRRFRDFQRAQSS